MITVFSLLRGPLVDPEVRMRAFSCKWDDLRATTARLPKILAGAVVRWDGLIPVVETQYSVFEQLAWGCTPSLPSRSLSSSSLCCFFDRACVVAMRNVFWIFSTPDIPRKAASVHGSSQKQCATSSCLCSVEFVRVTPSNLFILPQCVAVFFLVVRPCLHLGSAEITGSRYFELTLL